jgi:hypothetical protein
MPRHSTFGKLQRERDKRAKAAAKQERRAAMAAEPAEPVEPVVRDEQEEQRLLDELAALHRAFEDRTIGLDEFESRRDAIRDQLIS